MMRTLISTLRRMGAKSLKRAFGERRYLVWRARLTMPDECRHLRRVRLESLAPVRERLVLISQIHRSGGTLLSQLFDGHPQCHAHPDELNIGPPDYREWPVFDLHARPEAWYALLVEEHSALYFKNGYRKPGKGAGASFDVYPFLFLSRLQKAIFMKCASAQETCSQRDILNYYMTSYFNAWLDNHNLYSGPKRCVTAFTPRMYAKPENAERFFEAYPDGSMIYVIRDPRSWCASAQGDSKMQPWNVAKALRSWSLSATAMIEAKQSYGSRVYVLSFEDLLGDTERAMRSLAAYLDIDFSPVLLTPTFNGFPMRANSSFPVAGYGIQTAPLFQYRERLTADQISYIESHGLALYEQVCRLKA